MSRADAGSAVTSSPSSRMRPEVGNSSPAIIRNVVVLPQPEGPRMTKNEPSSTVKSTPLTAENVPKDLTTCSSLISAMALVRKMADDHESQRARQDRDKGIAVQVQRERLHQHHDSYSDQGHGDGFAGPAAQQAWKSGYAAVGLSVHLRTAPKVMPRSRWRRKRMVNSRIGRKNSVVAAATAGQSWPPSPMMKGMNGGMVCASPLVSSTANAYSFQAKIRQKMAVAAMPVVACGNTTLKKACRRL